MADAKNLDYVYDDNYACMIHFWNTPNKSRSVKLPLMLLINVKKIRKHQDVISVMEEHRNLD